MFQSRKTDDQCDRFIDTLRERIDLLAWVSMGSPNSPIIPLYRTFVPVSEHGRDLSVWGQLRERASAISWPRLLQNSCVVVLGEAGIGKTSELQAQTQSSERDVPPLTEGDSVGIESIHSGAPRGWRYARNRTTRGCLRQRLSARASRVAVELS